MRAARDDIRAFINLHPACVLVEVVDVKGSAPRDVGTWMLVSQEKIFRTIGGGQLEFMAIDHAREILAGRSNQPMDVPLGPEIGQCCGGRVGLEFHLLDQPLTDKLIRRIDAEIASRPQVYIFGAGHVGNALAVAFSQTPVRVTLVDTRESELLSINIPGVEICLAAMPEQVVREAPSGSAFIILTHDHALDFLITAEALQRGDAAYIGMIGSKTKKATLKNWLKRELGVASAIEKVICPIGSSSLKDKRPEVIAALVTAEVLTAVLALAAPMKTADQY